MSLVSEHPATTLPASGRVCTDARCATFLPADAEICDECGGTRLEALEDIDAMLCAWDDERPLVFALHADKPSIVGRSASGGQAPDIDLRRFAGSGVVHRHHAWLELEDGEWRVTHLGTNPLVVHGRETVVLEPGGTARLLSGDTLEVGGVLLEFVVRGRQLPRRI